MKVHPFCSLSAAALTVVLLAGCQSGTSARYAPAPSLAKLSVAFADPVWNGNVIPAGQQCGRYGGRGATPPLVVSNIPAGANAVIVEYNDSSYGPLATNGGHGKIGYRVPAGAMEVTVPAVPGGTRDVPDGVFIEADNRGYVPTGYLPPCSGGAGNLYIAKAYAVFKPEAAGGQARLLAESETFDLGRY